jgi:hypothetical protein
VARKKQFDRELDALWQRRNARLRRLVTSGRGPVKELTRRQRERAIERLVVLASAMHPLDQARRESRRLQHARRSRRLRPSKRSTRREDRFWGMIEWAERALRGRAFVYRFHAGKRCLYVGKAGRPGRLRAYKRDLAFARATRIVCSVTDRRYLDRLECITMHLHQPLLNRAPASRTGRKHCPVCRANRRIRREVRRIFAV